MYVGVKWLAFAAALIWLGSVAMSGWWQTAVIVAGNVALVHGTVSIVIEWRIRHRFA
ncbi:hypothetical protein [Demequina sp.]|uniref:hypothetical protein n=1 Tax=Demequina sp. TaxID=2050685 RepID=UPI003A83600A